MQKTEQQIREAAEKEFPYGDLSLYGPIEAERHRNHIDEKRLIYFTTYTQALSDMKEERKEVDLTELKKEWNDRTVFLRLSGEVDTEAIFDFFTEAFEPHLQQPAPSVNKVNSEPIDYDITKEE